MWLFGSFVSVVLLCSPEAITHEEMEELILACSIDLNHLDLHHIEGMEYEGLEFHSTRQLLCALQVRTNRNTRQLFLLRRLLFHVKCVISPSAYPCDVC